MAFSRRLAGLGCSIPRLGEAYRYPLTVGTVPLGVDLVTKAVKMAEAARVDGFRLEVTAMVDVAFCELTDSAEDVPVMFAVSPA